MVSSAGQHHWHRHAPLHPSPSPSPTPTPPPRSSAGTPLPDDQRVATFNWLLSLDSRLSPLLSEREAGSAPRSCKRCQERCRLEALELIKASAPPPSTDPGVSDGCGDGCGGGGACSNDHDDDSDQPPREYFCPISHEVMTDPVVAADGFTYERVSVETWFEHHSTSPMTGVQLQHLSLLPNLTLKALIADAAGDRLPVPAERPPLALDAPRPATTRRAAVQPSQGLRPLSRSAMARRRRAGRRGAAARPSACCVVS